MTTDMTAAPTSVSAVTTTVKATLSRWWTGMARSLTALADRSDLATCRAHGRGRMVSV
jgi:hypothetical protein